MPITCRHLLIHGRVQGVGFRWALHAQATTLGLSGWVRNRRDGSVEALICGQREAIDALTTWAWQGPPGACVERVIGNDEPDVEGIETRPGFERRPTV